MAQTADLSALSSAALATQQGRKRAASLLARACLARRPPAEDLIDAAVGALSAPCAEREGHITKPYGLLVEAALCLLLRAPQHEQIVPRLVRFFDGKTRAQLLDGFAAPAGRRFLRQRLYVYLALMDDVTLRDFEPVMAWLEAQTRHSITQMSLWDGGDPDPFYFHAHLFSPSFLRRRIQRAANGQVASHYELVLEIVRDKVKLRRRFLATPAAYKKYVARLQKSAGGTK